MPPKSSSLADQRARLEERIRKIEERQKVVAEQRAMILGRAALACMDADPSFRAVLLGHLDPYITKKRDRSHFLEYRQAADDEKASTQAASASPQSEKPIVQSPSETLDPPATPDPVGATPEPLPEAKRTSWSFRSGQ
ncbi:MAG: hypothetical protein AAGI44_09865 [Pseudomonadota bacterium]